MNPLPTYLWKEWREQRATLGVLAAGLCAGVAAVVGALPRQLASHPFAFQGVVALSLLTTVMSIGADLLARERAGAGLGFLERLPAGLGTAFRAKLVFFMLALAAAALYGASLATAAAFVRAGEWPHDVLGGSAPWLLALLMSVSLWVFAVSAWMPASALTFPGTLLLLAAFAWPAVLATKGDPLFRPTPYEGLAFALLCLAGAPASAWAGFVVGSRLGRTRCRAALAGLAVATLSFAPSWVWAAGRYASLKNAPFEVLAGWVGANGRYAFLDLMRKPPHGIAADAARTTALIVDLGRGSWSFAGEVDASAFVRPGDRSLRYLRKEQGREPLCLLNGVTALADSEGILFDPLTARALTRAEQQALPPTSLGPQDFGLHAQPAWYQIRAAGLGYLLRYRDGARTREIYRGADGEIVDAASLQSGEAGPAFGWVRVRHGRWLALDGNRWVWLDPATGEHGPLEDVEPKEWIGPLLDDGRLVLVAGAGVFLLDPDSGERTALRLLGDPQFELRFLSEGSGLSPLPAAAPCIVLASSRDDTRWAVLDVRAGTLELGPSNAGCLARPLWASSPVVIVLEDSERIVRLDLVAGTREELFSVSALH